MAFGQAADKPQTQTGVASERYEARSLVIVSGEDAKTKTGKVYWRVKDSAGKFYSVWDDVIYANLEIAAKNGETIPCAVQIQTKEDGKSFYSITGTGAATEGLVKAGAARAQAASQPGGKNSEFGKRMHPDDALRVTALAHEERAIQFITMIMDDRPEGMSREQFAKGKMMPVMQFLAGFTQMPKTLTPDSPAPKTEESPATQQAAGFSAPQTEPDDSDIPF